MASLGLTSTSPEGFEAALNPVTVADMAEAATNANARSVSMGSISSDGSNGGHHHLSHTPSSTEPRVDLDPLTADVREFKEALANLRRVFNPEEELTATLKVECHEKLSVALRILRHICEKYPSIPTKDLVQSARFLTHQVQEIGDDQLDENELVIAIDALARSFSNRISDYLMQDIDFASSSSSSKEKDPSHVELEGVALELREEALAPDQIDSLLLRHHQGVDHALRYAKVWAKYAKDVMTYVEKRTNLELEWARGLSKLAQATRPILKEESYLPLQSVYCTALDNDIEICSNILATCSRLQGNSFMVPLFNRRQEHRQVRKALKDRWNKEYKVLEECVANMRKVKALHAERKREYERCREAVRIAEQGAEIGATGDNKVDKRKRLEEEALEKRKESSNVFRNCVEEANRKHRQLMGVKAEILQQIRELIIQCDQTVKAVTVQYFQLHHSLSAPVPTQFHTLCERSRMYDPGSQFMEFVRCGLGDQPPPARFSTMDPFSFDEGVSPTGEVPRRFNDMQLTTGTYRFKGDHNPALPIEPSDTESDSRDSRDTSPSASPMINSRHLAGPPGLASAEDTDHDQPDHAVAAELQVGPESGVTAGAASSSRKSLAGHNFRKLKLPTNCRVCNNIVYSLQGYGCVECGLASHKKCLESLALQCGHRRLPPRVKTFGVDLSQHLLESGAQVPPLVIKCVHEIDKRGVHLQGIYRRNGAKTKIDRLWQMFETSPELVELTDVQPFAIADVLKTYIRMLPEPLITHHLYPEFIAAVTTEPTDDTDSDPKVVHQLAELSRKLPKPHQRTLGFLMHHLSRIAKEAEENKMDASNLSTIFGPTLMRPSEESTPSLSSSSHEKEAKVVEWLIVHAAAIFGSPESVLPKDYARYTNPAAAQLTAGASSSSAASRKSASRGGHKRDGGKKFGSGSGPELIASTGGEIPGADGANDEHLSDEDEDEQAIPSNWQEDESANKTKKSPLLNRGGASHSPYIIKASLGNYSGLEGVTPERLSTQGSLEANQKLSKQAEVLSSRKSIPHDASGTGVPRQHRTSETLFSRVGRSAKKHSLDEDFLSPPTNHPLLSERLSSEPGPLAQQQQQQADARKTPSPSSADHVDGGHDVLKSITSPGSGRTSLTIGIGLPSSASSTLVTASSSQPSRSSSLSEDHQALSLTEQRRKFLTSTSTDGSQSRSGVSVQHHQHQQPHSTPMSSSLPTGSIPNIEENRVTIQVPGGHRGGPQGSSVIRQSSVEKGD